MPWEGGGVGVCFAGNKGMEEKGMEKNMDPIILGFRGLGWFRVI